MIACPRVSGKKFDGTKVNRAVRNHMVGHQLQHNHRFDACTFCCKANCKMSVVVEGKDRLILGNYTALPCDTHLGDDNPTAVNLLCPSTMVHTNYTAYPSFVPFLYKVCKEATKAYTTLLSIPYWCHCWCKIFIWSCNIKSHYDNLHFDLFEEDKEIFRGYMKWEVDGSGSERESVLNKFNSRKRMADSW